MCVQEKFITECNATISNLGKLITDKKKKPPSSTQSHASDDDTDVWAKLLANKIKKMESIEGEEFKLEVDMLAMKRLKKK